VRRNQLCFFSFGWTRGFCFWVGASSACSKLTPWIEERCGWRWGMQLVLGTAFAAGVQVSSASSRLNIREENWQCGISLVNARTELVLVGTCLRNYALQPIDANRLLSLRGEPNAVPEPFLKGSRR